MKIVRNQFSNKNEKSIYNIGFLGIGKYSSKEHKKIYNIWHNIIRRCYGTEEKFKSYIGCLLDERWYNFQVFAEWYEENYVEGWHIDKDILIKNNKIYGPDTCCFVPTQINSLFIKAKSKRGDLPIGVSKHRDKFQVQLKKFGNQNNFGQFISIDEAFNKYKIEKEKYIHQVAEIWKSKISNNVYLCLINYNVEISD
jgi:hypothetical protein